MIPEKSKSINLNSNPIVSEQVFTYVSERIDFTLTFEQWKIIDVAMGEYWNNRIKGSWICNEDNAAVIFKLCQASKMLISYERVLRITNLIWEYLESKGRLLDE